MRQTIFLIFILSITNVFSQDSGLKNYYETLDYNSVYKVDLDINKWDFQHYYNSKVIIDIDENGGGKIILYYRSKHLFYIERNYKLTYSDGSGTYFFVLDNGNILRLGITSKNYLSAFSIVLNDNTTVTFANN